MVRAIYHDGQLRLLDAVDLEDGQEVQIEIIPQTPSLDAILGDLLVKFDEQTPFDEEAMQKHLDDVLKDVQPPLSQTIIEERREGR